MMNDEPVDLSSLRTPPPLGEHDYAAVRARVRSEIRRRRESARWPWLLPLAAAVLLAFVLTRRESQERPVVRPEVPAVAAAPREIAVADPITIPTPPLVQPAPPPVRTGSHHPRPSVEAPPMRIHIQTADPDVRIIWIIKEKSS